MYAGRQAEDRPGRVPRDCALEVRGRVNAHTGAHGTTRRIATAIVPGDALSVDWYGDGHSREHEYNATSHQGEA